MSKDNAPLWYARYMAGETYPQIAADAGVKQGTVSDAVYCYIRANKLPRRGKLAPTAQEARQDILKPIPTSLTCRNRAAILVGLVQPGAPASYAEAVGLDACRFITGDHEHFCGREREGHRPYCAEHARIAYTKPPRFTDVPDH